MAPPVGRYDNSKLHSSPERAKAHTPSDVKTCTIFARMKDILGNLISESSANAIGIAVSLVVTGGIMGTVGVFTSPMGALIVAIPAGALGFFAGVVTKMLLLPITEENPYWHHSRTTG